MFFYLILIKYDLTYYMCSCKIVIFSVVVWPGR